MSYTEIPTNVCSGRTIIRTDLDAGSINATNLKADLERVLPLHGYNRMQIRQLQEYHRGWHPAIQERVKTTRTDVDNKITVNYPYSLTRDIVGYFLGKPIQYTNRLGKWRKQMENFVQVLSAENKMLVDYKIAEDCSICGIGHRGIFAESAPTNGTHLKLMRLDPIDTFVVQSSNPIKPPVYAVTCYETTADQNKAVIYTVYTPNKQYRFKATGSVTGSDLPASDLEFMEGKDISFGGGLPIIEYENNQWRLGDWETAIALIDAIDFVTSDGVNDIQQAVNSVLVAIGVDMSQEVFENLSTNGFLNVKDVPPGVAPVIEFINQAMDASVGKEMRDYLEATLRVIVGVPDRKTRGGGGGDTGDAVFMRDGWQDIDLVATAKEPYFIQAERAALAVMLYILNTHSEVSNIVSTDIDIHFNRNKTANLQSKAQVYTGLTSGPAPLAPVDALDIAGLTNNVHDVIMRAESYAEDMQKKAIEAANVSKTDAPNSKQGGDPKTGTNDGTE